MVDEALTAGAVARRLGVAVTTLRTWHQRYGLGPSHHVPGQHRRYTPEDMDRLQVMRRLTAQGVAPAEAAAWARRVPVPIDVSSPIPPSHQAAPADAGTPHPEKARPARTDRRGPRGREDVSPPAGGAVSPGLSEPGAAAVEPRPSEGISSTEEQSEPGGRAAGTPGGGKSALGGSGGPRESDAGHPADGPDPRATAGRITLDAAAGADVGSGRDAPRSAAGADPLADGEAAYAGPPAGDQTTDARPLTGGHTTDPGPLAGGETAEVDFTTHGDAVLPALHPGLPLSEWPESDARAGSANAAPPADSDPFSRLGDRPAIDVVWPEQNGRIFVARDGGGHTIRTGRAGPAARGLARAAMRLDAPALRDILEMSVTDRGVISAWEEVIMPVLIGVGERYAATKRFIEVEHILSRGVTEVLGSVARPPSSQIPRVLLAAADEEQHTLPLEALAAALAQAGVSSRLLGARVPAQALADAIARTGPAVLVVWSQLPGTADPAQWSYVLSGRHRPLLVAAAGPGWQRDSLPEEVTLLGSLAEAVQLVSAVAVPVDRPR